MKNTKGRRLLLIAFLVSSILLGVWVLVGHRRIPRDAHPLPPISESRFRNTALDVGYVGIKTCLECHTDEHESYLQTKHSIALRDIAEVDRPPDADCAHLLSNRRYRVRGDGRAMRHLEFVNSSAGEVTLADFAPKYVVGSGSHSYTYLVEMGDFLMESPLTYYNPKEKWDLSPGYELNPNQPGFSRPINTTCVNCHSGGAESIGDSPYRFKIREMGVSCERCHGPGELHVAKWRDGGESSGDFDDTIVNPAHLDRGKLNSICAQCHLEGAARVRVKGRRDHDFRPGRNFQDFEVAFRLEMANEPMKVVGHVEQMQLSKCYQETEMTCVTCHKPHEPPTSANRVAYFRDACVKCHDSGACGVEEKERLLKVANDDCNTCHMPKSEVSVPHVAFTHHRIGVHRKKQSDSGGAGRLVPLHDLSHLPEIEQDRCMGLAYLEMAGIEGQGRQADAYSARAREILETVRAAGVRDSDLDSGLARIYQTVGSTVRALEMAESSLSYDFVSPSTRVASLDVIATVHFDRGRLRRARATLEKLVDLRHDADDWRRLAMCKLEAGDKDGALVAARTATEIAPHRPELHAFLADVLKSLGDDSRARKSIDRARSIDPSFGVRR